MNRNVLIVLAGGFLIAVMVALIVQSSLSGQKKPDLDLDRIQILVAAKNLKVGHEVQTGDLMWQDWSKSMIFAGAIIRDGQQSATEAAKGKLIRPIAEGEPVHMTLIVEDDRGDFLSANITKGMRAVGVSVKSHVLADRLIRPGDFVDVMMTYRVRINSRSNPEAQSIVNRYASETVIENIRILAIDTNDTKAVDEEEEGSSKSKKRAAKNATVTLEVSPEDAEKLMLATKMGDLGLALRSIGDQAPAQNDKNTTDVGMSKVMTSLSNMNGTSSAVRIYNGNQMTEVQARNTMPQEGVDFDVEDTQQDRPTILLAPEGFEALEE